MPKLNIQFRDPSSGQMHNVEGEVVKKIVQKDTQSTESLRSNPNDGQVDLFIHMDKNYQIWESPTNRESIHLQVNTEHLTDEQAVALGEAIRSGKGDAIKVEGNRKFNAISIQTDLWNEKSELFGAGEHKPDVSLTGNDDQALFLSKEGVFSTEVGGASGDLKTSAQALYQAAEAGDQLAEGENIFTRNGVSLETKQSTFEQIDGLLERAGDLGANGAAQVRSSAATVMTEMLMSLGTDGPEGELKEQVFGKLHSLIKNETMGGLKESMIFNAIRVQSGLSEASAEKVSELRTEIAPTAPPTDKWFADGKREINISYAAGHGENFYEGATEWFEEKGFKVVDEGNTGYWRSRPRELQLKKTFNGEEYTVNIDMRNYDDDSFKDIDNDDYDMVVYQGHSNLGANTRQSVENAPDGTGKDKLIFLGLCSGKDNIDRVRKNFPEAQLVTTFNSSYFNTKATSDGGRQFDGGEDIKAIMQIVDGAIEHQSWSEISDNIKDKAVGWHHKDNSIGNYVTPLDLQLGAKFRDLDNDGSAMTMDRHFNMDVLTVRSATREMFTPKNNNEEGQKLNGELPHLAAVFANTVDLYNPTFDKFSHKGRIMADGFFKGGDGAPPVKFETRIENGEKSYVMQVNEDFAHMGEEALRAVTMVEYNRHLAKTEEDYPIKDPVERELVGLLTGAASLSYDSGYRDAAVFGAMVDYYGLPEGLDWKDASKLINDEHHDYTGSQEMAKKWMKSMDPATLAALRQTLTQ